MATPCNIVLRHGSSTVYMYRQYDGYVAATGADLARKLAVAPDAGAFLLSILADPGDYVLTTGVHGDIEHLYEVAWHEGGPRIEHFEIDRGWEATQHGSLDLHEWCEYVQAEIDSENASYPGSFAPLVSSLTT